MTVQNTRYTKRVLQYDDTGHFTLNGIKNDARYYFKRINNIQVIFN